jgi:hypothetical protein
MNNIKMMTLHTNKNRAKEEAEKISCERCKNLSFRFGMKTYNVFKYMCVATIIIVASCFVTGCQKGEDIVTVDSSNEYLSLPDGFDFLNLSDEEYQIAQKALGRMFLCSKNGKFETKFTSGNQINISEELFNFFSAAITNSNSNKSKEIRISYPRLKTGTIESTYNSNDCVAHTIHAVCSLFGVSKLLSDIKQWLETKYGTQGVPNNRITAALNHYLEAAPTSLPSSYSYSNNNKIVVIERINDTIGHSGILHLVATGTVMYRDNQNGGYRYCTASDIIYTYSILGVR